MIPLPLADLVFIEQETQLRWERVRAELRGQTIFITGGTGFFGRWLVESFCYLNHHLDLQASLLVLSRNPERFYQTLPHLREETGLTLLSGDVRTFAFPSGCFPWIVHGAVDASLKLNRNDPQAMRSTLVEGMAHVLAFAEQCKARRLLLISSGAVYGAQPPELSHISEDYEPDSASEAHWGDAGATDAYTEGKRLAEKMALTIGETGRLAVVLARCFAFVGPHLPLDSHFAVGNFIRDALCDRPITLQGDGTPYRSYLYAADLVIWLWTLLLEGVAGRAYNVGSEEAMPLLAVARGVSDAFSDARLPVTVLQTPKPGVLPTRYVPSTQRAQSELGLRQLTDLPDALLKTAIWLRANG